MAPPKVDSVAQVLLVYVLICGFIVGSVPLETNPVMAELSSASKEYELGMTLTLSLKSLGSKKGNETSKEKKSANGKLKQGEPELPDIQEITLDPMQLKQEDRNVLLTLLQPFLNMAPSIVLHLLAMMPSKAKKQPESQYIPECGCRRKFLYRVDENNKGAKLRSSCSDAGTRIRAGQKVISYSLPYTTNPGDYNRTSTYKTNIVENLMRMRAIYPGFSMRLYTDLPLSGDYCQILCQNEDLFWCDISGEGTNVGDQSQMMYPTWKFLPLGDPTVDLFLSRDIASTLNERESSVVYDWLPLHKAFLVMRDNRNFHNVAMLGGLWGARNDLLRGATKGEETEGMKLLGKIISMSTLSDNSTYKYRNYDQDVLRRVIFYPKRKEIVAYDSYHCKDWRKFTVVRPFPTQRNVNEIMVETENVRGGSHNLAITKRYKPQKCPVECRPSYGKDWEYC